MAGPIRLENLIKLTRDYKLSHYRQAYQIEHGEGETWKDGREWARYRKRQGSRRWYSNTFRVVVAVSTVKLAFTVPPRPLNIADYSVAAAAVSNKTRSP